MPFILSDIHSPIIDLLTDDYTSNLSLKSKQQRGPLLLTLDTSRSTNGCLTTKLSSKFTYKNLTIDKLQLNQEANGALESRLTVCKNTVLGFIGDSRAASLNLEYRNSNVLLNSILDVQDFKKMSTTGKVTFNGKINLASEVSMDLVSSRINSVNMGLSYTTNGLTTSLTTLNGLHKPLMKLGVLYMINPNMSLASSIIHSCHDKTRNNVTIGTSYMVPFGQVKAKVDTQGSVKMVLVKTVGDGVRVTLGGGFNVGEEKCGKGLEWGLGITL